jgi:hypothetical protein
VAIIIRRPHWRPVPQALCAANARHFTGDSEIRAAFRDLLAAPTSRGQARYAVLLAELLRRRQCESGRPLRLELAA